MKPLPARPPSNVCLQLIPVPIARQRADGHCIVSIKQLCKFYHIFLNTKDHKFWQGSRNGVSQDQFAVLTSEFQERFTHAPVRYRWGFLYDGDLTTINQIANDRRHVRGTWTSQQDQQIRNFEDSDCQGWKCHRFEPVLSGHPVGLFDY